MPTAAPGWTVAPPDRAPGLDRRHRDAGRDRPGRASPPGEAALAEPDRLSSTTRPPKGPQRRPGGAAGAMARGPHRHGDALAAVPRGRKLPWFGPPMGAASMATARIMETWAHGQDIADGLGETRRPTARLRHVAHIGVRTRRLRLPLHDRPGADRGVPRRAGRPGRRDLDLGRTRRGKPGDRPGPRLLPPGHPAPPPRRPRT